MKISIEIAADDKKAACKALRQLVLELEVRDLGDETTFGLMNRPKVTWAAQVRVEDR